MPNSIIGNPFALPPVQPANLQIRLPDPYQSLAALMKMQMAQQRMALAAVRTAGGGGGGRARSGPQEGDPRYGKEVLVPQADGTKKRIWVWGTSQKERDAAEAQAISKATQDILAGDEKLQKDLANFENLSVPGRKEVLDKVRQEHAPRLAQILGIPGEELSKQLTTGLDRSIKEREKAIKNAGIGTQLMDAGKRIFRRGVDAISSIFDSSAEKLARGHAAAEAEAQAVKDNAFRDELARMEAEGRSTLGFQLSNPLRSGINIGSDLAAMIAPAVAGGAVGGLPGAILGGAAGAGTMSAAEALERVATDPNLTEAQKEEKIGQTEALSAGVAGALGSIPFGPSALLRPAVRATAARALPAAVPYRMLPGATAEEAAAVGQRWATERAIQTAPSIFREVPRHALDAATLGGAFQVGSNLAYGAGTGQNVPATEGLGEAVTSGAILGLPFGAVARMRQRTLSPVQRREMLRPSQTVNSIEDMGVLPSSYASGDAGAMPAPIWDYGTAPVRTTTALVPVERARQAQTQPSYATITPYGGFAELPMRGEPRALPPRYEGPMAQPEGSASPRMLPPGETAEQYAARINQNIINAPRALPDNVMYAADGRVIPLEASPESLAARNAALQAARNFFDTKPSSKQTAAYIRDALDKGNLTISDLQLLREERYNTKRKATAQSTVVKGIDKVLNDGNRTAAPASSAGESPSAMERVRPAGEGRVDTENTPVDSAVPRDTETAPATPADLTAPETPTSRAEIERRGNVRTEPQDTRTVEEATTAPVEPRARGAEGANGERGVESTTARDAAGGEGQRESGITGEQRTGDAGNAEPINAEPLTEEAAATVRKSAEAVQIAAQNPTPENLQEAQRAIAEVETAIQKLSPRNETIIAEEQAKPENEPPSVDYTRLQDERVFDEITRTQAIDTLTDTLNNKFAEIWPKRNNTPEFMDKVVKAFAKEAAGEKLSKEQQMLFNKARAKGVEPLDINKETLGQSVELAKAQGFDKVKGSDIITGNVPDSVKKIMENPWCV